MEILNIEKINDMPPRQVLVVDDDLTTEPIWDHIIKKADRNAQMLWATNYEQASTMIENAKRDGNPLSLVVADIFLEGKKTGVDLWKHFHSEMPQKILLISGVAPLRVSQEYAVLNNPIYLQKPVDISEAIQTVYELLHASKNSAV